VTTVILEIIAASFALYSHYRDATLIALLGAFGWGTFAASIFPLVAIGLTWKGTTVTGAATAVVTALSINLEAQFADIEFPYGLSG
tara:strand:- start:7649 stop:7906 length:258 start_codon:yes stop_codon:yes gene_type:complete